MTAETNKKDQLIEASIDLFSKEGFWNTSTAKIAKHAGVGTGTLFVYFESKDALIDAVYTRLKREALAYLLEGYPEDGDTKARIAHLFLSHARWAVFNPARFALLDQLKLSDLVSLSVREQLAEEFGFMDTAYAAAQPGVFVDIPLDYLRTIMFTLAAVAAKYAIAENLRGEDLDRHLEQSFTICWRGLAA